MAKTDRGQSLWNGQAPVSTDTVDPNTPAPVASAPTTIPASGVTAAIPTPPDAGVEVVHRHQPTYGHEPEN